MLGTGRRDIDRVGTIDHHIGSSIRERNILEPDVEVGVGIPLRPGGDVESIRQDPSQPIVPLGRTGAHGDHPVHDFNTRALLR
ncbi:hypothetical protein Q3A91_11560 [Nocardia mangyaensis]|nr:hypothetical protein [Nocardia mangyaensis]MDO3647604.1 hypothetical protein [Nocardia mangyaensis]